MDAIVAKEFDKDYPIELSRAISGAFVKGGLQYLATDSVRSENDTTRAIVGIGVSLLAQATTKADLRAWGTLPKQIQFCKIKTPTDKKLTLEGVDATLKEEVALNPAASTNLVWVRSVSAHSPLKVVGVFPSSPHQNDQKQFHSLPLLSHFASGGFCILWLQHESSSPNDEEKSG